MKRYVLLVGGTGARLADALIVAASAGVFPAEEISVLLADTDRRGVRSAGLVSAKMADYARVHQAMGHAEGPFRTELAFSAWPAKLPGDASTLAEMTADAAVDALLCQALFDKDAAALELHEGFHGRRMLGEVTFAGLLHEAEQDPEDVLSCMADDMAQAIREGEEVRVVLAGSVCGGTGAAGVAALCRYLRRRTEDKANIACILLGPCADEQDAPAAHAAIAAYAREGLCDTVCVLALPRASRSASPAEYAQLTDWLAVYAMDVLLHRPMWLKGVFTVRAPEGALSWQIFGKAAERYRLCYGGLMKAAAAWTGILSAKVEKRLRKPFLLRDGLFGWYAHFFRRMETDREEQLALLEPLGRLMNVCLIWLGGVCRTLPIDLAHASALAQARGEAEVHYQEMVDLFSRLAVMDDDARRAELYEDNQVYRGKNNVDAAEAEATLKRIAAAKQELTRRAAAQDTLNSRMGGVAAMNMLQDALDKAQQESDELHARYEEAVRRIDHAETIAAAEDQYRITDARTKLGRMERHQLLLDSRLQRIEADVQQAEAAGLRFDKPAAVSGAAENDMFLPEMAEKLLRREKMTRKNLEALWPGMVRPKESIAWKQALKEIRRADADRSTPVMSLVTALMHAAMKEG